MGGVLSPEVMYKCFVTPASREERWIEELPLVPGESGRECRREGREERTPPSPGEAMIKAVMLSWGPFWGGPLVLPITAALPLLFSILGKLSFCN